MLNGIDDLDHHEFSPASCPATLIPWATTRNGVSSSRSKEKSRVTAFDAVIALLSESSTRP